jgi:hypothetical protein
MQQNKSYGYGGYQGSQMQSSYMGGSQLGSNSVELRKAAQCQQIAIATERKGAAETDYFWSLVLSSSGEIAPRRANPAYHGEEAALFKTNTIARASTDEDSSHMDIYDQIPVERSGEGADLVPVLSSFEELSGLPDFLVRNITLMQYARPTPIQRHSIPLGLAGHDLMCCAQTGSGTYHPIPSV